MIDVGFSERRGYGENRLVLLSEWSRAVPQDAGVVILVVRRIAVRGHDQLGQPIVVEIRQDSTREEVPGKGVHGLAGADWQDCSIEQE